jgi:putative ABC transport system substrate-binding protein
MNFGFSILDFRLGVKDMTKISRTAFNQKSAIQNRKLVGLSLIAFVLVVTGAATEAQQPTKVPRIGYLSVSSLSGMADRIEVFRQGLRELGYAEGKNIVIEWRYGEDKPDQVSDLANELVRLKVDVIFSGGNSATQAAKKATNTIPIVMTRASDPIASGFIVSLARPGGNITGLSTLAPELSGKRLELLKEIAPRISRVAVFASSTSPDHAQVLKELELAAGPLGVKLQYLDIRSAKDFETAFQAAAKERAEAVLVRLPGPILSPHRTEVAALAVKHRLPVMYERAQEVEAGGLVSYGVSVPDLHRHAAIYVDKILKGTKPADLPVEQPKKFEFIINLNAAKQIGLTIPPNVLARADRVIR